MDELLEDIKSYVRMVAEGTCTVGEAMVKIDYLIEKYLKQQKQ